MLLGMLRGMQRRLRGMLRGLRGLLRGPLRVMLGCPHRLLRGLLLVLLLMLPLGLLRWMLHGTSKTSVSPRW